MPKAIWNDTVIAEAKEDEVQHVEGNVYFPPSALKKEYFQPSKTTSVCSWKGDCSYYTVNVNGKENPDAAWCYADPKPDAKEIKGHVAFWKGVTVE